jgi:iron complex outermembrane receptor protein
MNLVFRAALLATSSMWLLGSQAHAEAEAAPARSQAAIGGAVEEVIVTARRREERLQEVPSTVEALSPALLEHQSVKSFADLQGVVPGLIYSGSTAGGRKGSSFSIRGLRSNAISIYLDEVVRPPSGIDDYMYDLAAVEVLKGPQGTLFGGSTTAGAIVIRPQKPTDQFEGSLELRGGNYNTYGGTAVLNVPLGPAAALRFAIDGLSRDGYVKDLSGKRVLDEDRHVSGRISLRLHPTDTFENVTMADTYYYKAHLTAPYLRSFGQCSDLPTSLACIYSPATAAFLGIQSYAQAAAAAIAAGPFHTTLPPNLYPTGYWQNWGVVNISDLGIGQPLGAWAGDVKLRLILGYNTVKSSTHEEESDGTALEVFTIHTNTVDRRKSEEAQVQGNRPDGRFSWVIGAYHSDIENDDDPRTALVFPQVIPSINPSLSFSFNNQKETAGYAQGTLEVFPKLRATAGFRYTHSETKNYNYAFQGVRCSTAKSPGYDAAACANRLKVESDDPSWLFSLDYRFDPDTMAYATTRRGHTKAGFNAGALSTQDVAYGPERLTDIEIGAKRDWRFDGELRLRTNLSVYRDWYDDIQRSTFVFRVDSSGINRPEALTVNASKAIIQGVELDSTAWLTREFSTTFQASYMDAYYTNFPYTLSNGTRVNLKDNRMAQAPKWAYSASLDYNRDMPNKLGALSLSLQYQYQSTVFYSDFNGLNNALPNQNIKSTMQSGYGLLNGRASLSNINEKNISVSVWGRNLTDQLYYVNLGDGGQSGFVIGLPGKPRTFGVEVAYHF